LAGKISAGVTFNQILQDIRDTAAANGINRLHLVDKKDLHNIIRDYNLDKDIAHKDDTFSVEMWVQQYHSSINEDSPVLYFKMQGQNDGGPLEQDDFMIVIMTPYQRDVLIDFAAEKVCVDSTHKPTDHDFQLTTLVTVDEFGAGCPIAYCLSKRVDDTAMAKYFESVKSKVGLIQTKVLMSDDAPDINAWTEIMSKPDHHILCIWHVDRNWEANLNKIKDFKKRSEVYADCRTLLEWILKNFMIA